MDGVSSAFAVVSLSIQLVETGEKISQFLTSVQDAPSEVIKLGQNLDQLNTTLKQVSYLLEQQYLILRLPGSPVFITNALGICERRIKTLEDVIQRVKKSMDHPKRVQRSWAAIKFVSKKEDIQEMQSQLRDAETGLQMAMLSNSWQLQYIFREVNHLISADHRTECITSISQALAVYKLQRPKNRPWQHLLSMYQEVRECKTRRPLQKLPFVTWLKRHISSGMTASSDASISNSSRLL